jgi:hypothetical protein
MTYEFPAVAAPVRHLVRRRAIEHLAKAAALRHFLEGDRE